GPKPLSDLAVRVALPAGWRATRVRAFAPDLTPPSKLSFEQDSDIIRVDLPELTVYRAVCIEGGLR
ncbi:MAG: hypothetical protein JJ992_00130, partial [Planctomycetes bacterium]|nr:hypothetical protein [Planctomycetota bacterium]